MFVCMCVCVCRQVCSKERVPFKVLGEGEHSFRTQPVGNSSPSPLAVVQFAYPAILHSLFFFCRRKRRTEEISERRLQAKCRPAGEGSTVEIKLICNFLRVLVTEVECHLPVIGYTRFDLLFKIGTLLKGKPKSDRCKKMHAELRAE